MSYSIEALLKYEKENEKIIKKSETKEEADKRLKVRNAIWLNQRR